MKTAMRPTRQTNAADTRNTQQSESTRSPQQTNNRYPSAIPYLIANEAAERFSFFGMKAVLLTFMTTSMLTATGMPDTMSQAQAKGWFHIFLTAVYIAPIAGALIADLFIGKYLTIVTLSLIYCIGHATLAIDHTRTGLAMGLALIAIGSGGIKPCVSANLGDQMPKDSPLTSKVFSWFYLAINIGAFTSIIATPILLRRSGPAAAFALPGVHMLTATLLFLAATKKIVKKPPIPRQIRKDISTSTVKSNMASLLAIYALTSVFWSLFDQMGSSLLIQAGQMYRQIGEITILPEQVQAANPIFIIVLVPFITYMLYPALSRHGTLADTTKITTGMALAATAFAVAFLIQKRIDAGLVPHILWQSPVYLFLTTAEIMISVTCLEISYTRAPESMKSIIMAIFMLSIATGNLITASINFFTSHIAQNGPPISNTSLYLFFTALMLSATALFKILSPRLMPASKHRQ